MAELWHVEPDGTPGATVNAADIGADSKDGTGTAVYSVDGKGIVTTGQLRFTKAIERPPDDPEEGDPGGPIPVPGHVWIWIRRRSGIDGDNSNGTPSVATNIAEINAASHTTQNAIGITNSDKASLITPTGSGVSNKQSNRTIYNDGDIYDFVLDVDQISDTTDIYCHAGPDHSSFPQGFLLDSKTVNGAGVGDAAIIEARIGSMASGATAHVHTILKVVVSDTPIVIQEPDEGDAQLAHVETMPIADGTNTGYVLTVKVTGDGADAARITDTNLKTGETYVGDWVDLIASGPKKGYAKLERIADAWTDYEWEVEARVSGVPVPIGQPHTLRTVVAKGDPLPAEGVRWMLYGCQQANDHDRWAHDDAIAWGPHGRHHFGDITYANNPNESLASQIGSFETQQAVVGIQRQMFRDIPGFVQLSDHDGEGGNDVFATPCIPYAQEAARTLFGFPDLPVDGAHCYEYWIGRHHFVCADIRTLDRTDPFDSSDGFAVSAEQEAWLIDRILDPDAAFTHFMSDCPWLGQDDSDGKGDTWRARAYRAQRARIGAAMATRPDAVMIHCGDLHGVGASSGGALNPDGGAPVTQNAGIRSGQGDSNSKHNGDYDENLNKIANHWDHGYWPLLDNDAKVATYGRLTLFDDGVNVGVAWEGRCMAPGVPSNTPASINLGTSAPQQIEGGWSIGLPDEPNSQLDLSTWALNVQNRDAGWSFPPRRGDNTIIPTANGRLHNGQKPYDQGRLVFSMYALGSNPDGSVPPSRTQQVLANLAELDRYFTGAYLLELWRRDGAQVKRIYVEVVDAFDLNSHGGEVWGDFVVIFRTPQPFWEDLDIIEQVVDFAPPDDASDVLVFSAFAGMTAPNDSAVLTVYGQMDKPKLSDGNSIGYIQLKRQLDNAEEWVIDNNAFTSRETNHDTDEIRNTEWYGSGALLQVYPRHRDGMPAIRVAVDSPPGGQAKVKLAMRRRYVRA